MQEIKNIANTLAQNSTTNAAQKSSGGANFADALQNAVSDVDALQKESEKALADIATGSVKDLHQAAIAIDKAEVNMKLMLEVRNKALNAYKELSRTQI